ncbi:histidine kinase dimerization/phospho-acceptor domain-containing protein [Bacillus sp. MRMR6]|uniref:histidine kinase dimerization/phospho-acceptor domain-containing protein n=1 Tax=Bacillus sp. MRMR6 TaxID=1928617 RepID=UPI000952BD12|nr:histidine kinase dimerization/phospho-acceptor domain-containing protein [Bacillus sp. MRMR6]OLS40622.1 sensor histidine kinase [Bacillus sp. MRMR6]
MDTKWKSSIKLYVWSFLLMIGISGVATFLVAGSQYLHKDYFHTPEFQMELDQFTSLLSIFEFSDVTIDEAKKSIIVTEEEINEHRYRYGDLHEQVSNIKAQYEYRIEEAQATENQEAADTYIEERDGKIEDITNNFKSDDHVRQKIIQEKEKQIERYYKERESLRAEFSRYDKVFSYYFQNTNSDKVYTNLEESKQSSLNSSNMLFVKEYNVPGKFFSNYYDLSGKEVMEGSALFSTDGLFEGKIAISKTLPSTDWLMVEAENYKQDQMLLLANSLVSLILLVICLLTARKAKAVPAGIEKWRPYYNKLPIDVRLILLSIAVIGMALFIAVVSDGILYINQDPYVWGTEVILSLVAGALFITLVIIQGKLLKVDFTNWAEWDKSLSNFIWKNGRTLYHRAKHNFTDAFLDQSTGAQVFFVFIVVFMLGAAVIVVAAEPFFLVFYAILLAIVAVPLGLQIMKKVGYFNRIIEKTNELAAGKQGEDLPVVGKTVLASLAANLNLLKQGVKKSQSEQAKSERLKTELITNVSHDLRTPLTSIITYTELLKTEDLSQGDRDAYLEVIDRKSKRLKVLIDDLFEVSKMTSGSVQLTKEKIDLNQLLEQALAEYDETISQSNLHFRVTKADQPVYALVDGQKMWRVFDNLIGNVLKYSLENTRVYISVKTVDSQAIVTFKNVSKYELSENVDELLERFKRGDQSRHTEGSGLGLAIVKSIVDLHEGSLDFEADGDLFKVNISLKLED